MQFSVPRCCSHSLDLLLIPVFVIIQPATCRLTFPLRKSTRLFAELCNETGGDDGRIIITRVDRKWHGRVWIGFIWAQGRTSWGEGVGVSCVYGNEPSGFHELREFQFCINFTIRSYLFPTKLLSDPFYNGNTLCSM